MKINNKYYIKKQQKTDAIMTNIMGRGVKSIYTYNDSEYLHLYRILKIMRKYSYSDDWKNRAMRLPLERLGFQNDEIDARLIQVEVVEEPKVAETCTQPEQPKDANEIMKETVQKLLDFFSEFSFTPSLRFTNTLAYTTDVKEYVKNYFAIQDHQYAPEIAEKIKSAEFKDIIKNIKQFASPKEEINSRMKIYLGEPGTGKTTQATTEANKCIVCSSDMLPTDLMQNFAFEDGKAGFEKSDLWLAMENGEAIVLDEINMLPFESLRFLQGITDGKNFLDYKGFHIEIKDGFKIIGTMNLNIGGVALSIPAPLADRCSEIKELTMTADCLVNALI